MTFQSDLRSTLTSHPPLAALVGSRVYALRFPPGSPMPVVVYQRISNNTEQTIDSVIQARLERVQFTTFATGYDRGVEVDDALREAVVGMVGSTVQVHDRFIEGGMDDYDPDSELYRVMTDASILYSVAAIALRSTG